MIKTFFNDDWQANDALTSIVKMGRYGLAGHDKSAMEKRASLELVHALEKAALAPDEVPVLAVALTSTEAGGPNRNGDGFPEASCIKQAWTFEKHAKFFRNHDNKSNSPYYGRIIKAAYNLPMRRIDLLIGLNGSKRTCEKNGGEIADLELEKLASGRDIRTSMSTRVPWDICSGCHNKARSRTEYCKEGSCKRGGLAKNIGKLCKDGHVLHAINDDNDWFDITHVVLARQADRTAYVLGQLTKSASELDDRRDAVRAAVEKAASEFPGRFSDQFMILRKLTSGGEGIGHSPKQRFDIPKCSSMEHLQSLAKAAAQRRIVLSPAEFLTAVGETPEVAAQLATSLQKELTKAAASLMARNDLDHLLSTNPFVGRTVLGAHYQWAFGVDRFGETKTAAVREVRNRLFNNGKEASVGNSAELSDLAEHYLLYQVGAVSQFSGNRAQIDEAVALLAAKNC